MNCPNCGMPVSDGSKFCNTCGAPVAPIQTHPPVTNPVYQPPVQPVAPAPQTEPKKSNTGLIIGAVVAVAVVVVVFCILGFVKPGFLLKDGKTETASSVSQSTKTDAPAEKPSSDTKPTTPTQPVVDVRAAETAANAYLRDLTNYDMVSLCNREILTWNDVDQVVEKVLIEAVAAQTGYSMTAAQLYDLMSEEYGTPITNITEYINLSIESSSDSQDAINYKIDSSKVISSSEAGKYISKTKSSIDTYNAYGLDSDNCSWDGFESFVLVKAYVSNSSSLESVDLVLGYVDNDWVVIYVDDGTPSIYLSSLAFLAGMKSS